MTTCLGKSCSFGLLLREHLSNFVCVLFPHGTEGDKRDVIVLIPDHCLDQNR